MSKETKRKQSSVWVPNRWLEYTKEYYKNNEKVLAKLGIHKPTDLIWRMVELGRDELESLVTLLQHRNNAKTS